MVDLLFVTVTAALAWHAMTWRDAEGRPDTVRLLMGAIALLFCVRVLLVDVLGVFGG